MDNVNELQKLMNEHTLRSKVIGKVLNMRVGITSSHLMRVFMLERFRVNYGRIEHFLKRLVEMDYLEPYDHAADGTIYYRIKESLDGDTIDSAVADHSN